MIETFKWAIAAMILSLSLIVAFAGDLGPQPGIGGENAWNRNDYTHDSVIRVYERDATLDVPALALWTNSVVELPRPSMTLTQVYYMAYYNFWSTKDNNKTVPARILTRGQTVVSDYLGPMYAERPERPKFRNEFVYRVKPPDYVDAFVALTNGWAEELAEGETWHELDHMTTRYETMTANDPVTRRYYTSSPCRLGVTDQSFHGLPYTFSGLRFLEGAETNGTFKLVTGFNGYVHLRYNSESNTVTFTRLYEGIIPYDENN